ncbi:hypothetical protein HOA59_03095 [archaeon]|jgi:hypothetical protein|nr:hypothetical protein [archaeon]MBT6824395.1 hypothetical protein [archaeon]MBT7107326.1 hypothetical protein [archaeon]MBT7297371.1 hypothetical protein [archaeon]
MNKRGQFYIITVLVLAMATYAITMESNTLRKSILFEDFDALSQNYITESTKIINYAIENEDVGNIEDQLDNFTKSFLEYAKQRDPNVELVYIFSNGTNVTVSNYFDETNINYGNSTIFPTSQVVNQTITLEVGGKDFAHQTPISVGDLGKTWYTQSGATGEQMNLSISGFLHNFDLSSGPDFKVIIRTSSGEETIDLGAGDETWTPRSKLRGGEENFGERFIGVLQQIILS